MACVPPLSGCIPAISGSRRSRRTAGSVSPCSSSAPSIPSHYLQPSLSVSGTRCSSRACRLYAFCSRPAVVAERRCLARIATQQDGGRVDLRETRVRQVGSGGDVSRGYNVRAGSAISSAVRHLARQHRRNALLLLHSRPDQSIPPRLLRQIRRRRPSPPTTARWTVTSHHHTAVTSRSPAMASDPTAAAEPVRQTPGQHSAVRKVSRGTCTASDAAENHGRSASVRTVTRSTSPEPLPPAPSLAHLAEQIHSQLRANKRMKFARQPSDDGLTAPQTRLSVSGKQVDAGLLQRLENISLEDSKGPVIVFSGPEDEDQREPKSGGSSASPPSQQLTVPEEDVQAEPRRPPLS